MAGRWARAAAAAAVLAGGLAVVRLAAPPAQAAGVAGAPWLWGSRTDDQLFGRAPGVLTPVAGPLGWSFTDVSVGVVHTLAIGADGELYAWGRTTMGQLGNGMSGTGSPELSTPVRITFPGGAKPVHIAAGGESSAAITDDGSLWFWGSNGYGISGTGATGDRFAVPVRSFLPGGTLPRQVFLSYGYAAVLGDDGRAYTAGQNWNNELGNGVTQQIQQTTFVQVAIPGDARLTEVGYGAALGVDGNVYTWGSNNSGQMGTGSTGVWTDVRTASLPAGVRAVDLATGMMHRLALGSDGVVYAWGSNIRGQIGDGTTADRWAPVPVTLPGGVRPASVHAGSHHSAAVGADGRLYAWGSNYYGTLGDGTSTDRWTPVATRLPDGLSIVALGIGDNAGMAVLTGGGTPPPPPTTTTTMTAPPTATTTTAPPSPGTTAPPPTTIPPTTPPPSPVPPAGGSGRWAPGFVPVTPRRVLDTRTLGQRVPGGTVHVLPLASDVPVAATDAVLNVTVTEPSGPGFVTVYPCANDRPLASNLNMVAAGQTVPNLVTVSLDDDARLCLYTSVDAHLVADLAGWYELGGGSGLVAVTPRRLFDTRQAGAPVPRDGVHELDLRGTVDADADSVVLNVTATEAQGDGYVTVYPCAADRPLASNLNVRLGATTPNLVTVALGADQRLCFYASVSTHLLADLTAWYAPHSPVGYIGLVPDRVFDTRDVVGPVPAGHGVQVGFGPGEAMPGAVIAVVLNVTAVDPAGAGFVTVFPCTAGLPVASNLNVVAGQTVPNLVLTRTDDADDVCFYAHTTAHLVADIAGYFTDAS